MQGRIPNRLVSVVLLVALAPWCLGCATEVHLQRSAVAIAGDGNGQLLVRVFENASARRREISTRRRVVTELYRVEGKSNKLVRQASEARWSVSDLSPGDYVLKVESWVDDQGNARVLPSSFKRAFAIRANETAMADVVLSNGGKVWGKVAIWVAAGVAVLVVAMLVVRHDLESQHWLGGSFGR